MSGQVLPLDRSEMALDGCAQIISGGKDVQKEVPAEQGITSCGTSDHRNAETLHGFAATL